MPYPERDHARVRRPQRSRRRIAIRIRSSDEGWSGPIAHEVVAATAPKGQYRGAVVGCGRMGSTIDDEHVGKPNYPWPWAHAPAIIEARGVELVAGVDVDPDRLANFGQRWGVDALYSDLREMVASERPDIVCVTTKSTERAEVVIALAEAGVKAIYATKPMSRTLAEADAMIEACRSTGTILAISAHLNWYAPYTSAKALIDRGEIGPLRSIGCLSPFWLTNMHSHTLCLFRLFAGAPAKWVFAQMDDEEAAAGDEDLGGSGFIGYENGVLGIMNSRAPQHSWALEFNCERGRVVSRNHHAWFELWGEGGQDGAVQRQFPFPWRPRSSMVDAIEGVARSIEAGVEEVCPGEFGREALEIGIAMRESHRRGGVRVELPVEDRSLRLG